MVGALPALLAVLGIIAALVLAAWLIGWHQERVAAAEGAGWKDGFDHACELTRSTDRRWRQADAPPSFRLGPCV